MSSVKFRTESFDPEFRLAEEVAIMENTLYGDVPLSERKAYSDLERKWIANAPKVEDYVTKAFLEPERMMPVGMTDTVAVSILVSNGERMHMVHAEQQEFVRSWIAILQRCRYLIQFKEKMKELLRNAADDTLKPAVAIILRNERLLAFRDSLPKDPPDDGKEGLNAELEPRADSPVCSTRIVLERQAPENQVQAGESFQIYVNYYRDTKRWKKTAISGKCASSTNPGYAVAGKHLLLAYYCTDATVVIQVYNVNTHRLTYERYAPFAGPLRCTINEQGWFAVSDGRAVVATNLSEAYRHEIEDQIVTSIRITPSGSLYLGTYNGQVYEVSPVSILSYNKLRDCGAVVSVSNRGTAVTVNSIVHSQIHYNLRRPLTVFTKGTFVISLNKQGLIRIGSTVHSGVDIRFTQTTAKVTSVIPWYDDGIWFDGSTLAVLHPEGSVRVIRI
jgi:hypothetical protein